MEFWSRLIGGTPSPKKKKTRPTPETTAQGSQARLARFRRVFNNVLDLSNRPRNPSAEGPLLDQLRQCLERIAALIQEETRAAAPHLCLQFAASNQIYIAIARVATVSQYEPIIAAAVSVLSALVDSEEEDFLSSAPFARNLMRLVTKVMGGGHLLLGEHTETAILELLFTISAKIRMQPEILTVWFRSNARVRLGDDYVNNEKNFVGITAKEDFPLCYILMDHVHHEGRVGDFARTGLLYIYEASGRSADLEEWLVCSDLPTLMASGLGALYSQLSRELSIAQPDATLPPVLAMSDYTTTHPRVDATSAFSDDHVSHLRTFLSYLTFWQDVLNHCRSDDVKATLLDHFRVLFLQQLLYPSLLQSSDTDAGSSVAVLTYLAAMLDALEHAPLVDMILTYLLAMSDDIGNGSATPETGGPPSPAALKRRQSLHVLQTLKSRSDAIEPSLFNLADLVINSMRSESTQTVFAALTLFTTVMTTQRSYVFGTLLQIHANVAGAAIRTCGGLKVEVHKYLELAEALHPRYSIEHAYSGLCADTRHVIEAQASLAADDGDLSATDGVNAVTQSYVPLADPALRSAVDLLRTFFTNSVDVNLAVSQAMVAVFSCTEVDLSGWLAMDPTRYSFDDDGEPILRPWQAYLDDEEKAMWSAQQQAQGHPQWTDENMPVLYAILNQLCQKLDMVRSKVPNLDQLVAGRKEMLQATPSELSEMEPSSALQEPQSETRVASASHSRGTSRSSIQISGNEATGRLASRRRSLAASPQPSDPGTTPARALPSSSIFRPPPPEMPSTTDVLMQVIEFPGIASGEESSGPSRKVSLNHVLTNVVILQEFVLELAAILQTRAAVLGATEIRYV